MHICVFLIYVIFSVGLYLSFLYLNNLSESLITYHKLSVFSYSPYQNYPNITIIDEKVFLSLGQGRLCLCFILYDILHLVDIQYTS